MTRRALLVFCCAAVALLCALSTRGEIFWLLFWLLMAMAAVSLVSVIWTRLTLQISSRVTPEKAVRGEQAVLLIQIRHTCPLPVASVRLDVSALGEGQLSLYSPVRPFVKNALRYGLECPHVGAYASGVQGVQVRDVYGLFSLYLRVKGAQAHELVVLPQTYLTRPLEFSPGESDNESALARAFEDATMPTDIRAFQQGDELKKVHWKLSLRRKELLVRVYDQPQRPDALLLVDCSPPDGAVGVSAHVRDAVCEAAASVALAALENGAPVYMPLLGGTPVEVSASGGGDIAAVLDALARCAFDGTEAFERVLQLETRRMRRTGSTAVVTSRLNPALADMILRIRRMGPKVRLLLVADPDDETVRLITARLMRSDVEVEITELAAR